MFSSSKIARNSISTVSRPGRARRIRRGDSSAAWSPPTCSRHVNASSPAARSRSTDASLHCMRPPSSRRRASIPGRAEVSRSASSRRRRGPLSSRKAVIRIVVSTPMVMPLPSEALQVSPSTPLKTLPSSSATPSASATPTTRPFAGSRPSCATVRMPSTKSRPMMINRMAPMTGPGTASSMAVSLGRNASANRMPPMTYPTVRAATPVRLMRDTLDGRYTMTGGVAAIPESRIPTPLALSAPCTRRKSVACGLRDEAR